LTDENGEPLSEYLSSIFYFSDQALGKSFMIDTTKVIPSFETQVIDIYIKAITIG